ncbi:MAG: SDR family oxidoreductase [Acidimicrobiales bacterium]|jgi:NAD(P)-dependent dehydrogenase (short-subunit alcohol dehydrogenase family)|nr:SDR family oxidoreductase [Acidimicrobiales bacterium]
MADPTPPSRPDADPIATSGVPPRVALVTGAGSGIGRAAAVRLAREAAVFLHDRDAAGLASTAALVADAGGVAQVHVGDLSSAAACRDAVEACVARFGGLDVLANIAGVALVEHLSAISEEGYRRVMAVNADAVFFLSQAALPQLLERRGCIVNLASSAGVSGVAFNTAYCMSKGAVVQLTRAMAVEFAHSGLRVNAIAPGAVDTPMTRQLSMPADIDVDLLLRSSLPGRAPAQADEVAELVAFLASDAAAAMNGAVVTVDGGATAG